MKLIDINKNYGKKTVLKEVTLTFPDKGHILLVGRNGSGKTTILNMIAKRISYQGIIEYPADFKLKQDLFYVYSEKNLFPRMTLWENARILLDESHLEQFKKYLEQFGLQKLMKRKAYVLSDGEKQKVSLIFAFVIRAKITLLDEPLEFIDRQSRPLFRREIKELSRTCLVIETGHQFFLTDRVYQYEHHGFTLVCEEETNCKEEISYEQNQHRHPFWTMAITFWRYPKKLMVLFYFLIILLLSFSISFYNLKNITQKDIYRDVYHHTDSPLCYSYRFAQAADFDGFTKKRVFASDTLFTRYSLELDYDEEEKYHPYFFADRNHYYKVPYLVESNEIILNGAKTEIQDYEIYISDYIYAATFAKKTKLTTGRDYYKIINNVLIPKTLPEEWNEDTIYVPKAVGTHIDFKIKIYQTDFKDKWISSDFEDSEVFKKQMLECTDRIKEYYNYAYMTPKTLSFFLNNLYEANSDSIKQGITDGGILLDEFMVMPQQYFNGLNQPYQLRGNEVFGNSIFFDNYLNQAPVYGQSYDLTFSWNGKTYHRQVTMTETSSHIAITRPLLVVSHSLIKELYDYFGWGTSESYPTSMSCYFINPEFEDIDFLQSCDFAEKDNYLNRWAKKQALDYFLIVFLFILPILLVLLSVLYLILIVRKEYLKQMRFKAKGFTAMEIIRNNYLIRVVVLTLVLVLAVWIGHTITPLVAKLFGILC